MRLVNTNVESIQSTVSGLLNEWKKCKKLRVVEMIVINPTEKCKYQAQKPKMIHRKSKDVKCDTDAFENKLRKEIERMSLTREELKEVHNNVMTIMENRVMQMTGCDRTTANLVANEVLDLDRDAENILERGE